MPAFSLLPQRTLSFRRLLLLVALATTLAAGFSAAGVVVPTQRADAAYRLLVAYCNDVYVRTSPTGAIIGTLYAGQSFDVYSTSGNYHYGFAYGGVNKWGYVNRFCMG